MEKVARIDVVFDEYIKDSLKATVRGKRGKGIRRRVHPNNSIPNWESFLRVDQNKKELFAYMAELAITIRADDKLVIATKGEDILCNKRQDGSNLSPCTHEEADTRLLLHAADCSRNGYSKVMIRTVDTDVLVIAVTLFEKLHLQELWISFGKGNTHRFIPAHEISNVLGPQKSAALSFFHAFTGCDQTSAFVGRGKNTAWNTWVVYDEVTPAFVALGSSPTVEMVMESMPLIEQFVVLMYDKVSLCIGVDQAREDLFSRKAKQIELIPPTSAALLEHTKRAVHQAGYCWRQSLVSDQQLPSPTDWGWKKPLTNTWVPLWTQLPEASRACHQLTKCGCQPTKGCRGRCKCVRINLKCTALCKCAGDCEWSHAVKNIIKHDVNINEHMLLGSPSSKEIGGLTHIMGYVRLETRECS